MPPFGPTRRRDLVRHLRTLGFMGPFAGGRHEFMMRGGLALTLPNPHRSEVGRDLLARILRQASIERTEWERLYPNLSTVSRESLLHKGRPQTPALCPGPLR